MKGVFLQNCPAQPKGAQFESFLNISGTLEIFFEVIHSSYAYQLVSSMLKTELILH